MSVMAVARIAVPLHQLMEEAAKDFCAFRQQRLGGRETAPQHPDLDSLDYRLSNDTHYRERLFAAIMQFFHLCNAHGFSTSFENVQTFWKNGLKLDLRPSLTRKLRPFATLRLMKKRGLIADDRHYSLIPTPAAAPAAARDPRLAPALAPAPAAARDPRLTPAPALAPAPAPALAQAPAPAPALAVARDPRLPAPASAAPASAAPASAAPAPAAPAPAAPAGQKKKKKKKKAAKARSMRIPTYKEIDQAAENAKQTAGLVYAETGDQYYKHALFLFIVECTKLQHRPNAECLEIFCCSYLGLKQKKKLTKYLKAFRHSLVNKRSDGTYQAKKVCFE
jgi:hypothetical protein